MNKFYEIGSARQAKVNELFARVAPRYDLINDLQSVGLHRFWKRRLVQLAAPQVGEKALDLCCGTGDITLALAKAGAEVAGLDLNLPMLRIAQKRIKAQPRGSSVHWLCGDAARAPYPDASFDLITIGYGLRNLPDWERGLREMWRLTRPGGRFLILEFGHPENRLWRLFYFAYLKMIVPLFGRLFCGDADTHAYILQSLRHYPGQRGVDAQLRAMNCEDVRIVDLLGGIMSINYARRA